MLIKLLWICRSLRLALYIAVYTSSTCVAEHIKFDTSHNRALACKHQPPPPSSLFLSGTTCSHFGLYRGQAAMQQCNQTQHVRDTAGTSTWGCTRALKWLWKYRARTQQQNIATNSNGDITAYYSLRSKKSDVFDFEISCLTVRFIQKLYVNYKIN